MISKHYVQYAEMSCKVIVLFRFKIFYVITHFTKIDEYAIGSDTRPRADLFINIYISPNKHLALIDV